MRADGSERANEPQAVVGEPMTVRELYGMLTRLFGAFRASDLPNEVVVTVGKVGEPTTFGEFLATTPEEATPRGDEEEDRA